MVAGRLVHGKAQRHRQGTKTTDLKGFYYRQVLRRDEVVECSVLKEPDLTAGEKLRW